MGERHNDRWAQKRSFVLPILQINIKYTHYSALNGCLMEVKDGKLVEMYNTVKQSLCCFGNKRSRGAY